MGFQWREDKVCLLKEFGAENGVHPVPDVVRGPKYCDCFTYDSAWGGEFDVAIISDVNSSFECLIECQGNVECKIFQWRQDRVCFLKSKEAKDGVHEAHGVIRGPKYC